MFLRLDQMSRSVEHGVADTTAVSNTGFSWRAGKIHTGTGVFTAESGSILHWVAMGV